MSSLKDERPGTSTGRFAAFGQQRATAGAAASLPAMMPLQDQKQWGRPPGAYGSGRPRRRGQRRLANENQPGVFGDPQHGDQWQMPTITIRRCRRSSSRSPSFSFSVGMRWPPLHPDGAVARFVSTGRTVSPDWYGSRDCFTRFTYFTKFTVLIPQTVGYITAPAAA